MTTSYFLLSPHTSRSLLTLILKWWIIYYFSAIYSAFPSCCFFFFLIDGLLKLLRQNLHIHTRFYSFIQLQRFSLLYCIINFSIGSFHQHIIIFFLPISVSGSSLLPLVYTKKNMVILDFFLSHHIISPSRNPTGSTFKIDLEPDDFSPSLLLHPGLSHHHLVPRLLRQLPLWPPYFYPDPPTNYSQCSS